MQPVPWTPPRTIRINFATNRNIANPTARDATRFGNDVGELSYGTALVDILVKKTHGERPPSQEKPRADAAGQFYGRSAHQRLTEDDFFRRSATRFGRTSAAEPTTKNDVVVFVHGYNNSFRFSCVRLAQLVYDTRFEGKPVLFSWPANGGDSLIDELSGHRRATAATATMPRRASMRWPRCCGRSRPIARKPQSATDQAWRRSPRRAQHGLPVTGRCAGKTAQRAGRPASGRSNRSSSRRPTSIPMTCCGCCNAFARRPSG